MKKIIDFIKDETGTHYELKEEVSVTISGKGVTDIFGICEQMICLDNLTIWFDSTDNKVVLTAHPFKSDELMWDGVTGLPDTDYESMLASLFHDLLYVYMEDLSSKINKPVKEVRKWADQIFWAIWNGASRSWVEKLKAKIAFGTVRTFGGIYHTVSKWFLIIAALSLLSGCCVPDWNLDDVENGEAVQEVIDNGNK